MKRAHDEEQLVPAWEEAVGEEAVGDDVDPYKHPDFNLSDYVSASDFPLPGPECVSHGDVREMSECMLHTLHPQVHTATVLGVLCHVISHFCHQQASQAVPGVTVRL
jgi:hypothetical protein